MLKAIGGRLPDYGGEVRVNGIDLRLQLPEARRSIGYLPETLLGYGWMTIEQHLRFLAHFFPAWDVGYAAQLLKRLELPLEAKLGTLSKGMKVKLSFVAAEAYRPETLLLDEPTSGLDPIVRRDVIEVILDRVPRGGDRSVLFLGSFERHSPGRRGRGRPPTGTRWGPPFRNPLLQTRAW
jgi:ABC-2 type transport system ATP-binding protein